MSTQSPKLSWGHININVSDLNQSIAFYQRLGFEVLMPAIPYLGLSLSQQASTIHQSSADALGLDAGLSGRACIMQLGDGYPKLDLIELTAEKQQAPLSNRDLGIVRLCLGTGNLGETYDSLLEQGVRFLSSPQCAKNGLADIAVCMDPDDSLIELIQVYREKWAALTPESS